MADPLKQAKQMADYNNKIYQQNWQKSANFNAREAQKNRDWQERMANSAHQREIKDLKAAGLNPVLSVTGGSGAATPSGSSASSGIADVDTSMPNLIIDMATSQMNNATRLQEMAMSTQSAQSIAMLEAISAMDRHTTPSGNSTLGQVLYGLDLLGGWTKTGKNSRRRSTGNAFLDTYYNNFEKSGKPGTDIDELIYDLTDGKYGKKPMSIKGKIGYAAEKLARNSQSETKRKYGFNPYKKNMSATSAFKKFSKYIKKRYKR